MRTDGSCWQFRQDVVSDDRSELRRAQEHAASCEECSGILDADRRIVDAATAWRQASPALPDGLESCIAAALAAEPPVAGAILAVNAPTRRSTPIWRWAAAAVVILLAGALAFRGLAPRSDLEQAMIEVERAERAYARAIAGLEVEATAVLAKAGEPALDPGRAGILLAYRDRLTHLDSVIFEVTGFLEENPGHSGGHTVLLAAYQEKQDVLQEVLDLQLGELS